MGTLRFAVGDRVLAARAEDGHGHEQATVVDAYELLINLEPRPMVVVDFDDGERRWMTAAAPNVLALPAEASAADDEAPAEDDEQELEQEEDEGFADEQVFGDEPGAPDGHEFEGDDAEDEL
jgi:hypothetical protein